MQYFYSFLITLLKFFKLKLEASIIIIRFVSFLISIIIIAFAKNFFVKDKKKFINYSIFFLVLFPLVNFHISHFGIELLVFSISFLVWTQIYNCVKKEEKNNLILIIPIMIGLVSSIKFSAISLYFFYLFTLFFLVNYSFYKKILISIYSFITFSITFIILTLPSVRYYPKLYNKIVREIKFDPLLVDNFKILIFTILITTIIFFLIFYFYNKKIVKYFKKNIIMFYYIFFIFIFILILINLFLSIDYSNFLSTYFSIPSAFRNFLPILPAFIILFINITNKINTKLFIFLLILNFVTYFNFFYNNKNYVDNFINNNHKYIIAFSDSLFNSKYYFSEYTKLRYGNNNISFPNYWVKQKKFKVFLNEQFKEWIDKIDLQISDNLSKNDKSRINLRKHFKSKEYSKNNKYKIISLNRPNYNSRLLKDYCIFFNKNHLIIFDNNLQGQINNIIFFENSIEKIEKKCDVKFIEKKEKNKIFVFNFE